MFTIDRNKSLVNFTGSNILRLQKPNHASHLTVGGIWYQRVHFSNLSQLQRGDVCSMNCNRRLSKIYWTHHTTNLEQWSKCGGCIYRRSLLFRFPKYVQCAQHYCNTRCVAVRTHRHSLSMFSVHNITVTHVVLLSEHIVTLQFVMYIQCAQHYCKRMCCCQNTPLHSTICYVRSVSTTLL
jgi:hypothetical protein